MDFSFSLLQKNSLNHRPWDTATSSGWRSSPGSNGRITDDDGGRTRPMDPHRVLTHLE